MPHAKSAPKPRANSKPKPPAEPKPKPKPNPNAPKTPDVSLRGDELHVCFDTRQYRIRGIERNLSPHQLRVNILARRDDLVHLDTLDLCKAKSRASFIKATACELYCEEPVIKRDVGQILLQLEQVQQDQFEAATRSSQVVPVELSDSERNDAMALLTDPKLIERILHDFLLCGLVGEDTNKLVCYLACVSRKLPNPLAVLIQSGSASGKTTLLDAALAFMPDHEYFRYSAMTSQSLYYMGQQDLKHKILAIAEEEGMAHASYALKLLQSDGSLRIAAAGKNQGTGRQQTEIYEVEGPSAIFLTTTSEHPNNELQNRFVIVRVDESAEQTDAIHAAQRMAYTLDGQRLAIERAKALKRQQNAQCLLKPYRVLIPWAEQLGFRRDQTRMRRDHAKYLSLIASSTLLHQFQRSRHTQPAEGDEAPQEYLEATLDDLRLANRLASQVMGQSLDALSPQSKQSLELLSAHIADRCKRERKPRSHIRFTQRELREAFGLGDFQLRHQLSRLIELEYVLVYRTGRGNQRNYELLYDGQGRDGEKFLLGLTDPDTLQATTVKR